MQLAQRIDEGPWPILGAGDLDPETSQPPPSDSAALALARVLRHRRLLVERDPLPADSFDAALRCALTQLITGRDCPPPAGTAPGLRSLRDRISVPRDMPLHAARLLRTALERTAQLDPRDPWGRGPAIPLQHRRDQNPAAFVQARAAALIPGA
jgi:glutathione S-transferase